VFSSTLVLSRPYRLPARPFDVEAQDGYTPRFAHLISAATRAMVP
jgi:hypothetical protein